MTVHVCSFLLMLAILQHSSATPMDQLKAEQCEQAGGDECERDEAVMLQHNARIAATVSGSDHAERSAGLVHDSSTVSNPTAADGEESVLVLAEMSVLVYQLRQGMGRTNTTIECPWTHANGLTVALPCKTGYTVGDCHEDAVDMNPATYFPAYCVFKKETPARQAVIAIEGTDGDIFLDPIQDLGYFVGGVFPRVAFQTLSAKVAELREQGYRVLITGHSLGGYLSEVVATHHKLPGIGFCAPGPDSAGNLHTGRRIGRTTHPGFHIINVDGDGIGNLNWPHAFHATHPIFITKELSQTYQHSMVELWVELRKIADFEHATNVNVDSYTDAGQRRRRASYSMSASTTVRTVPECRNNDTCLVAKNSWHGYTCETATEWCEDYTWQGDVLECCPIACRDQKFDISAAPCKRQNIDPWEQCYNSDWCLRSQPGWLYGSACRRSLQHCNGEHADDMMRCCAPACADESVDISSAPCAM